MSSGSGKPELCFACDHAIEERSDETNGQPALFCEGLHKRWAHAACVGVSDELYQVLGECDSPWVCAECMKFAISSISDLAKLKSEVAQLSQKK